MFFKRLLTLSVCMLGLNSVIWAEKEKALEKIFYIPLISFDSAECQTGWYANPWGGGQMKSKIIKSENEKFSSWLSIGFKDAKGTLSNQALFERLAPKIKKSGVTGFYLWYRAKSLQGKLVQETTYNLGAKGKQVFSARVGIKADGKWHRVLVPYGGWNKQGVRAQIKDFCNVVYIFYGTGLLDIAEFGFYCRGKQLPGLLKSNKKQLPVRKMEAVLPIKVDGVLDENEWSKVSGIVLTKALDDKLAGIELADNKTSIKVLADKNGLYCGSRCEKPDIKKLVRSYKEDSIRIWEDECIEYYFDPGRSCGKKQVKFTVNANGNKAIGSHALARGTAVQTASKVFDTYWETEIFIPWELLQGGRTLNGFNVTRTCYDGGKIEERSGWTTTLWNGIKDYGILFILPETASAKITPENYNLSFYKTSEKGGRYIVSGFNAGSDKPCSLSVYAPETGQWVLSQKASLKGLFRETVNYPVAVSGYYHLNLLIQDAKGDVCSFKEAQVAENAFGEYKSLNADDIALFPVPKVFKNGGKFRELLPSITLYCPENLGFCNDYLGRELKRFYSIQLKTLEDKSDIYFGLLNDPVVKKQIELAGKCEDIKKIQFDGFIVIVDKERIVVGGNDKRGVFYGVNALLDLIKMSSGDIGKPKVCHALVVDWPDFEKRFFHQMIQSFYPFRKYDVSLFTEMLNKIPVHFRYNGFLFQVDDYYQWECAPKMRFPYAWNKKEYGDIIHFLNERYIPVMPSIQSHGHMRWLLAKPQYGFTHLCEDGEPWNICTRHPETYKTLYSFYDEALRVCGKNKEFTPKYFFTSLDEVRWKTARIAPGKRCKYCLGITKNEIYRDHIKKITSYLDKKNVQMMMCTDMLTEGHNGLNEFKCAHVLKDLPKNVLMCHWSILDYPSIPKFQKLGFENWKFSTGYKIRRDYEEFVKGHCFNVCTYYWWLAQNRCKSNAAYGIMAQAMYANGIWNNFSDMDNTSWQKYVKIYGRHLMRNWSRKPLLKSGKGFFSVALDGVVNSNVVTENEWFGGRNGGLKHMDFACKKIAGIPVAFAKKDKQPACVIVKGKADAQVVIKVSKKAASLVFLHAANLPRSERVEFWKRKNYGDPIKGKDIAEFEVLYQDNTKECIKIRFGWNVNHWRYDPLDLKQVFGKYLIDSRWIWQGKTEQAMKNALPEDIAIYQYEWLNPHSDKEIVSVTLKGKQASVDYALLAITGRTIK